MAPVGIHPKIFSPKGRWRVRTGKAAGIFMVMMLGAWLAMPAAWARVLAPRRMASGQAILGNDRVRVSCVRVEESKGLSATYRDDPC